MLAPVKLIRSLLILLAGAASALADTNLFNDGTWLIDGVTTPGTNARSINIVVDKQLVGEFSELKFYYDAGNGSFAQVFSIQGNGTWQPALPSPGEAGGVFRLASYWDCDQGFVGPMAVTELGWKTKAGKKGRLELTGKLSNSNSLAADKMKVTFLPVKTDQLRVDLDFQLRATRNFCVDLTRQEEQDQFRAVTMHSNFTSTNGYANDLVRFIKIKSKDCAGIYGCLTKKESFCIPLSSAPAGYLVNSPRRLGESRMLLAHTTTAPRNTPSLAVQYTKPGQGRIKPQGFITPANDPSLENVEYWGNWVDVKSEYKARRQIGRFRVTLEATAPKLFNCDTEQTPAP